VPSLLSVQGTTVEVQVFLFLPQLLSAVLKFENAVSSCENVSIFFSKYVRQDSDRNAFIHFQVPPMECQGPAKLLLDNTEYPLASVVVYDPQSISVLSVSPSLVNSAGGSLVTVSIHCGSSSICSDSKVVDGLEVYLKLGSNVVSNCSSLTLSSPDSLKCTFAAPAVAVETSSRQLIVLDLHFAGLSLTRQVSLIVIRRIPRVIFCNVSSFSSAFANANRFVALEFRHLAWNPNFRAVLELPSAKILHLTTIAQRPHSTDTTLIIFMLPQIAADETGTASFIFQTSGSQELTFSWPIHIVGSASLSITRVAPEILSSTLPNGQFLRLVVFGPSSPSKVSLLHLPALNVPIIISSSCN
jgi:hypothetical protein